MHHLWQANPTARWYIFCDDDTYLYSQSLLRLLSNQNSSQPEVVSHFWCSWMTITEHMVPARDCHPFAQGGSGVMFSRAMMDILGPHLPNCSEKYNDAEHAAAMRVTVCVERLLGYDMWTKDRVIKHWKTGLHPGKPVTALVGGNTWEAPATFHQVDPAEMMNLKKGHWVNGGDGFFDFNFFSMKTVPVEITYRRYWQMHFGYAVDNFGTHSQRVAAVTDLLWDGTGFKQEFEGNLSVLVKCDPRMGPEEVRVDEIERGPKIVVHLALDCPAKQPWHK
jgi:hypothetical protein